VARFRQSRDVVEEFSIVCEGVACVAGNNEMRSVLLVVLATTSLAACASNQRPRAPEASFALAEAALAQTPQQLEDTAYRIGPTDLLNVRVFQVPDLSFDEVRVDAGGDLQMPIIGAVRAAGLTAEELSRRLEASLGERTLRNPRVSVTVVEAASQKVTVDGAVTKAGVYTMRGRTTLSQAVAMAEGPSRSADLKSIAIFRTVEGRRMVAVFDLGAIRRGQTEDPIVRGDDVVIVDTSRTSAAIRDIIATLPALGVFAYVL